MTAPVIVETTQEQSFKVSPEQLDAALTDKTRLVVLNSPSNPSGKLYTMNEMKALGEVLKNYPDAIIATDDMYEHIVWTEEGFCNILNACPELKPRTVVMNGVSKAYAMTGWRIGYAGGPEQIINAMKKIQSQSTSNPTSISQWASVAALTGGNDCITPMLAAFKERHDFVVNALNQMTGVSCIESDGTFYAFPNVQAAIDANPETRSRLRLRHRGPHQALIRHQHGKSRKSHAKNDRITQCRLTSSESTANIPLLSIP